MVAVRTGKAAARTVASGGVARSRSGAQARLWAEREPRIVRDAKLGGRMLIATSLLIAEEVCRVAHGEVITFSELRARLAARFKADRTCPLTTGTFASVVAGAVGEDIAHHRKPRCPIWRLVRDDGSLNTNWALDSRYRAALLREEGRRVTRTKAAWRILPRAPKEATL